MAEANPYLVLGLPRSRTFWIANWLNSAKRACGHDLLVSCQTMDNLIDSYFVSVAGTVETGGMAAVRLLQAKVPNLRVVLIRRSLDAVCDSLNRAGIGFVWDDLRNKNELLDELAQQPGVESIEYSDLAEQACCEWLYEYCNGVTAEAGLWLIMQGQNLQINLAERMEKLILGQERIVNLKLDCKARLEELDGLSGLVIRKESYYTFWQEWDTLARVHFAETDGELSNRPYAPDWNFFESQYRTGVFHIVTARRAGTLIGYLIWQIGSDPESFGRRLALMGPWYVKPGNQKVAVALFDFGIAMLRELSVDNYICHHREEGRGRTLGKFFAWRGGIQTQVNFQFSLAEPDHG